MKPQFEVSKEFRFEAAHCLPHLPEGHKCRRPHGHSYKVVVICRGPLDHRGFVVDYAEIAEAWKPLDELLDHHDLNQVFLDNRGDGPTTAENLAAFIYPRLKRSLPTLYQIEVHETATTVVRYPIYDGRIAVRMSDYSMCDQQERLKTAPPRREHNDPWPANEVDA